MPRFKSFHHYIPSGDATVAAASELRILSIESTGTVRIRHTDGSITTENALKRQLDTWVSVSHSKSGETTLKVDKDRLKRIAKAMKTTFQDLDAQAEASKRSSIKESWTKFSKCCDDLERLAKRDDPSTINSDATSLKSDMLFHIRNVLFQSNYEWEERH